MRVSAIIPTRNRAKMLELNLRKLLKLGVDQIVIVDDDSHDKTSLVVERFANQHNDLVYVRSDKREGSAKTRNIGLSKARGDIILMMDDDTILRDASCLHAAIEDVKLYSSIGIVGGPTCPVYKLSLDSPFYISSAESLTKLTGFVFLNNSYASKTIVSYVSHPFVIRREIGNSVHYDEEMQGTAYREESDYQLRVRKKGWKILFDPRFVSYHYCQDKGGNRDQIMEERMYWKSRNHAWFIKKHHTGLKCIFYLLIGFGILALYQPCHLEKTLKGYVRGLRITNQKSPF